MKERRDTTILLIGALKFAKGLLLFALAAGAFTLLGADVDARLSTFVERLHFDPDSGYFREFITQVVGLSPKLPLFIIGFFAYGSVFLVEGAGLLKRKHWAEYFTSFVTASFLPLELYEFIRKGTVLKASIFILNLLILIYFIRRLSRERARRAEEVPLIADQQES